jgi:spore coat polysaccharide biosynthesis protein SpsF
MNCGRFFVKTICIVQARIGSTRLPGKVLLPLNGHTVIGEVLTRCKRIPGVDEVVCAIPDRGNIKLRNEALRYCEVYLGPEENVLQRYLLAAEWAKAGVIMRVTGDCPLIHPDVCAAVLSAFKGGYASNIEPRTFPKGFDCEVFDMMTLREAEENCYFSEDREHVTTAMRDRGGVNVKNPWPDVWPPHQRVCIDTWEDYEVVCKLFGHEANQRLRAA